MLTAKGFEGEDVSETLAAVIRGEPDCGLLPGDTGAAGWRGPRNPQQERHKRISDMSSPLTSEFKPMRPVEFYILLALAEGNLHGYGIIQSTLERSHGEDGPPCQKSHRRPARFW